MVTLGLVAGEYLPQVAFSPGVASTYPQVAFICPSVLFVFQRPRGVRLIVRSSVWISTLTCRPGRPARDTAPARELDLAPLLTRAPAEMLPKNTVCRWVSLAAQEPRARESTAELPAQALPGHVLGFVATLAGAGSSVQASQ